MAIWGVGGQGSIEPSYVVSTEEAAYRYANIRMRLQQEPQTIYVSYARVNEKDIWIENDIVCPIHCTAKDSTVHEYTRREVVTRRMEFIMPTPAPWAEVYKMIAHVKEEWVKSQDRVPGSLIPDDVPLLTVEDDAIIASFQMESYS